MKKLKNNTTEFFNRLEHTWHYYLDMEKVVQREIDRINAKISEENCELFPEFVGIDNRYKGLLREGLLIQICSLLEYSMVQVSKQLMPEYETKLRNKRGSWLDKHLALFGQKNIEELDAKDVLYFSDFIRIRNCFVHSNGFINQYRYPDQIEKTVASLQELGEKQNTDIIEISDDGYIILGVDSLPEVFSRGEEVMRPVFEYAFQELQSR